MDLDSIPKESHIDQDETESASFPTIYGAFLEEEVPFIQMIDLTSED